jgi:diacylglycerol kinase family enzyme
VTAPTIRPTVTERLRALVALLAMVAAVGVLLSGLLHSWWAVLIVIGGLLLTLAGLSDALGQRGFGRGLAVALVVGGLATAGLGLVASDLDARRIAALAALSVLSLALARGALVRDELRSLASASSAVPGAAHPVLLLNPRSGGAGSHEHLLESCDARSVRVVVLEEGADLQELARQAVANGADAIGMAGGDGSQALVAEVAADNDIPLVVIPTGTRNHFALDLGVDRDDPLGALDAFSGGFERRVDIGTVNGRVFVNNVALGVYAVLVQSDTYRTAKGRTALEVLPDRLPPKAKPFDLRYTTPDGTAQESAQLVLVSNGAYRLHRFAAGRLRRASVDRGELGIVSARFDRAGDLARLVALEATGRGRRFPGWFEWTTARFRVDSGGPVDVAVDGEALVLDPPLLFESRPGALRVRLPSAAVSRKAAAGRIRLVSHSTVARLVAVILAR